MNEQTQVPAEIAMLITQKKNLMDAEAKAKAAKEAADTQATIEKGKEIWSQFVESSLALVPEWLRPYQTSDLDEESFRRFGNHWSKPEYIDFKVPGLAPLLFDPDRKRWKSPSAHYDRWEESESVPRWNWSSASWNLDLERELIDAQFQFNRLENLKAEAKDEKLKEAEQLHVHEQNQERIEVKQTAAQIARESEEQALFNVFKDDPIAINLLKAFLMIRQERSMFESQIEDANETMYSIEERWSRRAADLHREADDAQRRAEEERDRVRNLQNDLDDAEDKLKKAKRGW